MSKNKSIFNQLGDTFTLTSLANFTNMEGVVLGEPNALLFKYINIACGRYIWDNLPNGITSKDIETRLLFNGRVFFTDDDSYGLICLSATPTEFNIYNKPIKVRVEGLGYKKEFSTKEGVLINDNLTPDYPAILEVIKDCHILTDIDKTLHMNLGQQKFPVIFTKTSNTELSVNQFAEDTFNEYFPVQIVDKKMEKALGDKLENVKALNTGVPYLLDKLQDYRQQKESEILTYLGVNNVSIFKKERLISDEANSNNDFIKLNLEIGYQERLKACRLINEKYNLNMTVKKYTDLLEVGESENDIKHTQ